MNKPKNDPYASLKVKEFRFFIAMRLLATIAFSIQFLITEWVVWDVTKDALYLGLVALAEIVPVILFSLFISGQKVDESEKRNALLYCLIGTFVVALLLSFFLSDTFINTVSQFTFLGAIYTTFFIWGIIRSFYAPSAFSLFSRILPKNLYANGATINSSIWQIGLVIGPAIGGFVYAYLNAQYSLWLVSFIILITIIIILQIKRKEIITLPTQAKNKAFTGLHFIFNNKIILSALLIDMIAVLFGGAVALLPIFADTILNTDARGLGILRAAPAVGSIISMVTIAYFPINHKTGIKLLVCVFLFGLSIVGFGLSELFWLSFIILILSGIFDGVSVVIRSTILQILTPDEMKGRVSAANSIFVGSSNEFGAVESGITAKIFGPVRAVVLGGCITMGFVLTAYGKAKALKKFELKDHQE